MFPESLPLGQLIYREPSQKGDGKLRIARQLAGQFIRQVGQRVSTEADSV